MIVRSKACDVALVTCLAILAATCGGTGTLKSPPPPTNYVISAAVSGLTGALVLQDNGSDNLTVTANGTFAFATQIASGGTYKVAVFTQPSGQTCSLGSNSSGTVTANVTVTVTCTTTPVNYTISVAVSGLTGTLVLQDNGSDNLTITTNGTFAFATQIASGGAYNVVVMTQPSGQSCSLGSNSSGTANANVTVTVTCTTMPVNYTISALVSGLTGTLVLQDNGSDNLTIAANGTFNFASKIAAGGTYSVSVLTQPSGQTCSLGGNSSGTANANVTVTATCTTTPVNYTISAAVSGLTGTLVLQDKGSDNLTIAGNGTFNFASKIAAGGTYSVSVLTQPSGQTCSLGSNSSGTANANVTVTATCTITPVNYTISAAVSGLTGTVVLQDNATDNLTIIANGTFAFATQIGSGATYDVTVLTQPSGQTCTLSSNSSGTANANVTVVVTCSASTYAFGVYTNKNDNFRTGQNLQETVLTPQNVNVNTFGKLFSYDIDGAVQAQPLYVPNVYIPIPLNGTSGYHNVVYLATANDSVYAYDADGLVQGPLWKDSFIDPPSVVPVPGSCVVANSSIIGITPTPVIDPATNTMYVEARTLEGQTTACSGTYVHRLHALDIATGDEKFDGPVEIQASVPGTGEGSVGGVLSFDPRKENSRPGLLLSQSAQDQNSVVFMGTASNQDTQPYHGWVLGYDSQTLEQKYVFCTTPNGGLGGIWQMGGGLAADADGNIFVQTGNGTFDNTTDFGMSVLKLTPNNGTLQLADSYTPSNYATLNRNDWDVSSGGLLLLPDQSGSNPHLMIGGGKEGTIYVMNRDNLGGYKADSDSIVQYIVGAIKPSVSGEQTYGIWNTPSYFQGNVYIFGQYDYPKMFTLNNGLLPTTPTSTSKTIMRGPAAMISANGSTNGIVWVLQYEIATPILWAFNPNDLTQEYYDTGQNPARDKVATKTIPRVNPTIANGRVYVPSNQTVEVYGLLQ